MAAEPARVEPPSTTVRRGPESLGYSRFKWILVALAAGLSIAFFAFFAFSSKQSADQAARNAEHETRTLVALLAEQAQQAFVGVTVTLAAVVSDAGDTADWNDRPSLEALMRRYIGIDGRILHLTLVDISGKARATTAFGSMAESYVERGFGETLRQRQPGEFYVDLPRRDPDTGQWSASVAMAVIDRSGGLRGVVVAEVPRSFFERFYRRLDVGRRSAFGIIDRRGAIVARTPPIERFFGIPLTGHPFFETGLRAVETTDIGVSRVAGFDSIERIFAFSVVPGLPYIVYAGAAADDYLANWHENIRVTLPFSALVVAIFIFLMLALARHLGRLEESEASIRLSDARYQTLVANIPGIVFQRRRDANGRAEITWMSDAIEAQLGISAAACVRERGKPLSRATHPDDLRVLREAYERSARDMVSMTWTGRVRRADGSWRRFELTSRPRKAADGAIVWEGIALDATDRIVAEQALESVRTQLDMKKAQLELALSNMAQGMCVYDADLRLVVFNQRYLELYGLENAGIKEGSTLEDTMRASIALGNYTPDRAEAIVRERLASARLHEPKKLVQRLENGRTIEVDSRPLADGGSVSSFTDITERENAGVALRQAKEMVELADRAKSQFLANMSHELRTPLNAIIGFAEIMTDKLFGPLGDARYEEYALDIRESGRHLLTLINDILDLSKIEARQANLREEQVDLGEIFTSCGRLVAERAQRGTIELDILSADDIPAIWADRIKLKQILLNLLSNAIKFTPPGGKVTLTAVRQANRDVAITVADTGIGMRAQDIPIALQPFRQIESTLARRHEGTGLGLPLTKAIVEMHGGTLTVQSEPGKGTTVTAIMPAERVIDPHGVQDAQLAEAIHAARNAL
jgi:PAS domain S-box-containing protein